MTYSTTSDEGKDLAEEQVTHRDPVAMKQATGRLVSALAESGWPRMPALVFCALLSSDAGGLTSAELTESLGVSSAAVSHAVRYLADLNLVDRERQPGSRRELYRVRNDIWRASIERGLRSLARTEDALRESRDVLGEETPAGRRVAGALAFYEFYRQQVSGLVDGWDEQKRSLEA